MYVNFCMYVCTYMYIHVHCTNLIVILWPLAKFACLICQCQLRYLLISNQRHSESKRGMNIWERTSLFVVAWCAKKILNYRVSSWTMWLILRIEMWNVYVCKQCNNNEILKSICGIKTTKIFMIHKYF